MSKRKILLTKKFVMTCQYKQCALLPEVSNPLGSSFSVMANTNRQTNTQHRDIAGRRLNRPKGRCSENLTDLTRSPQLGGEGGPGESQTMSATQLPCCADGFPNFTRQLAKTVWRLTPIPWLQCLS